jgi:putative membrane protein
MRNDNVVKQEGMMGKHFRRGVLNFVIGCVVLGMTSCQQRQQVQAAHDPVLTPTDKDFIAQAEKDYIQERALSQLVATKSADKRIKSYADNLFKEHSDALQKLDAIMQKYGVKEPESPEEQQKAAAPLARLPRKSLDREFVKLMVEDHTKAMAVFQQEANTAGDSDVRHYAIDQLPMLDNHLKQARELETKIGLVKKTAKKL